MDGIGGTGGMGGIGGIGGIAVMGVSGPPEAPAMNATALPARSRKIPTWVGINSTVSNECSILIVPVENHTIIQPGDNLSVPIENRLHILLDAK